jgi:hypothetical protein
LSMSSLALVALDKPEVLCECLSRQIKSLVFIGGVLEEERVCYPASQEQHAEDFQIIFVFNKNKGCHRIEEERKASYMLVWIQRNHS